MCGEGEEQQEDGERGYKKVEREETEEISIFKSI